MSAPSLKQPTLGVFFKKQVQGQSALVAFRTPEEIQALNDADKKRREDKESRAVEIRAREQLLVSWFQLLDLVDADKPRPKHFGRLPLHLS